MNQERAGVRIVAGKEQQAGLRVKDLHRPGEKQAFSDTHEYWESYDFRR